jgi:uncharacterized protein YaiI (UPF0178 family)
VKIWVDADACPRTIKEIIFRASERLNLPVCLVANRDVYVPSSTLVSTVRVPADFEMADNYIVKHVKPEDLVITSDIPLAAEIVSRGAVAIHPRGDLFTEENIGERLSYRNFMHQLRSEGIMDDKSSKQGTAGGAMAGRQRFADVLDGLLTKRMKDKKT